MAEENTLPGGPLDPLGMLNRPVNREPVAPEPPTVYARVVNGQIVEYPVFAMHIENRAHPYSWYTEVVGTPPKVDRFHGYKETLKLKDGKIYATYELTTQTLDDLLTLAHRRRMDMMRPGTEAELTVADIDPEVMGRITELVKEMVQKQLDDFAAVKGYDGIMSATTYSGSTVQGFQSDAQTAIIARDTAWTSLYTYMDEVVAGTKSVPKTQAEIEAILPVLVW